MNQNQLLLQIISKHILMLQNRNESFGALFYYLKIDSLYFVTF